MKPGPKNVTDPVRRAEMRARALEALKKANEPEAIRRREENRKKVYAEKANFKKLAKYMLEAELPDGDEVRAELQRRGFRHGSYQAAVILAQLKRAAYDGDTEAAKFVRDSAGFKPTEALQVSSQDDVPFIQINLEKMSSAELREMIARGEGQAEE